MGGRGSGRKPDGYEASCPAGIRLLEWAKKREKEETKPLARLALELDVDPRTLMKWMVGSAEPTVSQAHHIERETGGVVSIAMWLPKGKRR
jgi:hypothetical protein